MGGGGADQKSTMEDDGYFLNEHNIGLKDRRLVTDTELFRR